MPDERPLAEDLVSFLTDPNGLRLKEPLEAQEAAKQILGLYEKSGREGATFNLRFGDMSSHPLYSVSLWPERGELPSDDALSVQLQPFIERNSDLLSRSGDPRCAVGLWYNADVDAVYVDIVAVLPDREEAIELALRYDQIAIYDLGNLIEINTGGSGNTPAGIPPAKERLPEMRQEEEEQL